MPINQFHQVNGLHLSFQTAGLDGIFNIDHTEGTGRDNHVCTGLFGHLNPYLPHPFFLYGLIKQHQSATPAAKGSVPAIFGHLHPLDPWNRIDNRPRIVIDVVMPAEITRIVIGINFVRVLNLF